METLKLIGEYGLTLVAVVILAIVVWRLWKFYNAKLDAQELKYEAIIQGYRDEIKELHGQLQTQAGEFAAVVNNMTRICPGPRSGG